MKKGFHLLFAVLFVFAAINANAYVEWGEPEVVPEKLKRKNRRVMRFYGTTKPGALVRIRKGRIKLYTDDGRARWARIPQKNKVQFPVKADGSGEFSFDLYLPTVAVELPVEVKSKRGWRPYNLNFRVPDSGKAGEFSAIEKSFMAQEDDSSLGGIDKGEGYYSRKNDQGMMVGDRDRNKKYVSSAAQAWGALGLSYFNTGTTISGQGVDALVQDNSGSSVVIPAFSFGVDYDYSKKYRLAAAVRSVSGSSEDIGDASIVTGRDFTWVQAQASVVWFSEMLARKKGKLGFDFGLQLQQLPYFRERPAVANVTFFDNNTYNLHVGLHYETSHHKRWNYEVYGRFLYPFSTGDTFDIESSFPIMMEFGGGLQRPLTRSLAFGVFGQFNYFSMDVSYSDPLSGGRTGGLDLMLFSIDARLIVNF